MADIVLKDRSGNPVQYPGVECIQVNTVGGETVEFVDPALIPESVETTVGLDFSSGNMEVSPADGQVFSKVNIPVPKNLTPANIAEGVDIAGIIGTLAGGSKIRFATGTVTTELTSGKVTVTHGLGIVPDIIFVWGASNTMRSICSVGVSKAFTSLYGFDKAVAIKYDSYRKDHTYITDNIDDENAYTSCVANANDTTFEWVGTSTYKIPANSKWLAITGLT